MQTMRDLLLWLQNDLGKGAEDYSQSWSEALLGSLNFWGLLEGTHLLALMLFAGTILFVDLRLLGALFRKTPVSVVSDKILPLTIVGLVIMLITGALLFYSKPIFYYHNIWFRLKLLFLLGAMVNIAVFHYRIQKKIVDWDHDAKPPRAARISAIVSISAWILIITMGRFMAYNWFDCGKPLSDFMNSAQSCAVSEKGAVNLQGVKL
jgi:hypothetical protein